MSRNNRQRSNKKTQALSPARPAPVGNTLEQLPPSQNLPNGQIVQRSTTSWSGPLPPPSILDGYSTAVQNGAERLFVLVENQEKHRITWEVNQQAHEREQIRLIERNELITRMLGAALIMLCVGIAATIHFTGGDWKAAGLFVGLPILGVIKEISSSRKRDNSSQAKSSTSSKSNNSHSR